MADHEGVSNSKHHSFVQGLYSFTSIYYLSNEITYLILYTEDTPRPPPPQRNNLGCAPLSPQIRLIILLDQIPQVLFEKLDQFPPVKIININWNQDCMKLIALEGITVSKQPTESSSTNKVIKTESSSTDRVIKHRFCRHRALACARTLGAPQKFAFFSTKNTRFQVKFVGKW
jgi:hypothetical protein